MEDVKVKDNQVELHSMTLGALFGIDVCKNKLDGRLTISNISPAVQSSVAEKKLEGSLTIPDYQRIYCWEEKQVYKLLDDIVDSSGVYHLGSIILHKTDNKLAIVDGQQRLVTLTLVLDALGQQCALLEEKFESEDAQSFIGYNKFLIKNYVDKQYPNPELKKNAIKKIIENIQFSVLIINDANIDLAYTFFSSQNSRGKALTDYELLKAHHLRYIKEEAQAKHLAERWDRLQQNTDEENNAKKLGRTMGIFLFRMRKWMRKRTWNDEEKFKVKTEFEAAPIIADIPPFGEQFKFNESIQGGTHFFAYAEHFVFQFKIFSNTKESQLLNQHLSHETHWWYRDAIDCLLFAYFLKFGTLYLAESMVCIEKIISQHRYRSGRSSLKGVLEHTGMSEIIMMIDQATSPTFFIAECVNKIKKFSALNPNDIAGIRKRYENAQKLIFKNLDKEFSIKEIKDFATL